MKSNYLLCIALVFFGLTVQAQTNKINFEITDANEGNLLSNVLIRVDSDTAIKASNYLGKITFLNLSEGIHTFSFTADNFIVVTQTLIVPKDGVVNQKIYLSPKDISQKVILESTRMLTKLEDSPTKFVVINQKDLLSANNLNPANVSKILGEVSNIQVNKLLLLQQIQTLDFLVWKENTRKFCAMEFLFTMITPEILESRNYHRSMWNK